jgi:hypothetical protein
MAENIINIDPNILSQNGFELSDQNIIPSFEITGLFTPGVDTVEYFVYDLNKNLISSNYDFKNWFIYQDPSLTDKNKVSTIELSPSDDLENLGLNIGSYYSLYNFIYREFNSSINNNFYVSDISGDRTELRLKSNIIPNELIKEGYNSVREKLDNPQYFDELYISFGENQSLIIINVDIEENENISILVKLYEPLPQEYDLKDTVYIFSKIAESKAYQVEFEDDFIFVDDIIKIKGPNLNLDIKDRVNNSTNYQSKSSLLQTNNSSSLNQLLSILEEQSIELNIDYTDFSNFVHFSNIEKRIENFYYKVGQIQTYESDLSLISTITGSTSQSIQTINNKVLIENKIQNIIQNFDGYEYYLYFESSSFSYPKSGTLPPYTLLPTNDPQVLTWLGSTSPTSIYYGGLLLSASLYDENNQSSILYSIPEYLRNSSNNEPYIVFVEMVAQLFDYLWLYSKYSTQKLQAKNNMNLGIPPELVKDALESLGFNLYSNNYNNQDNFTSWLGLTPDTNFAPPTGSELITNYIAANLTSSLVNSWDPYGTQSPLTDNNYVYPTDDISKEIYKRIYHNLPILVKTKGTLTSLKLLLNIFGVPETILRIKEFGGKDKNNINNWDTFNKRYNYAYKTFNSSSVLIPWMPLHKNLIESNEYIVPDTIQFRFKTEGIPLTSPFTQSLLVKKSDSTASTDFDFGLFLYYTGSLTSGSYSGSIANEYNQYGNLRFYLSGSLSQGGTLSSSDLYLPFFNGDWWSIMLKRNEHISASNSSSITSYTLYAKNKIYEGYDGDQIGFQAQTTISSSSSSSVFLYGSASFGSASYGSSIIISGSYTQAWNNFGTSSLDGIYLGGYISGSNVGNINLSPQDNIFSGSFQEFRYYGLPLDEYVFDNFVMDPESIEGMRLEGVSSSFDILNFRAPLGNELESIFLPTTTSYSSVHPAVQPQSPTLITSSFIDPNTNNSSSLFQVLFYDNSITGGYSEPNYEIIYQNTPALGLKGEVDDKIQIVPNISYGTVLSNQISIQQNYLPSQSSSPDINSLEIGFSPQNEINDDIIQQLGSFNIGEYIGDPRQRLTINYNDLQELRDEYFKKYNKPYNILDYIRLIKYFDNSLFKTLKDFTPARTKLATGIIIKPSLLERQKTPPIQISYQEQTYTSSIDMVSIKGSSGGVMPIINGISGSGPGFNISPITQSFTYNIPSLLGNIAVTQSSHDEFYNGELPGTELRVVQQVLNPECQIILKGNTIESFYKPTFYNSSVNNNWGVNEFINYTNPSTGEVYLLNVFGAVNITTGAFTPPGIHYIKISKFDINNNDKTNILNQIDKLILKFTDIGIAEYTIINIQEYSDYYLYQINPQNQVSTTDNEILNYNLNVGPVSSSPLNITGSDGFTIINWVSPSVNPLGYFKSFSQGSPYSGGGYEVQKAANTSINMSFSVNFNGALAAFPVIQLYSNIRGLIGGVTGSSFGGSFNTSLPNLYDNEIIYPVVRRQSVGQIVNASFTMSPSDSSLSAVNILTVLEPYVSPTFYNSDCNALNNNAVDNRTTQNIFDVDYPYASIISQNINAVLTQTAPKAQVQASNYSSLRVINPRYNGSTLEGKEINEYNNGDISYGKTPVIEQNPKYFGYFDWVGSFEPELKGATAAHTLYLVDEEGNSTPLIDDEIVYNDFKNNFEAFNQIKISINQYDPPNTNGLFNINTNHDLLYVGADITPIIHCDGGLNYPISSSNTIIFTDSNLNISHSINRTAGVNITSGNNYIDLIISSTFITTGTPSTIGDILSTNASGTIFNPTPKNYIQTFPSRSGTNYDEINTPFNIQKYDQIRFDYDENQTYIINDIRLTTISLSPFITSYRLILNKPLQSVTNSSPFLIRRVVPDPSFIIFKYNKTSGVNGNGFIYTKYVNPKISKNQVNILKKLKEDNTI